jgi:hypothetical protein
MSNPIVKEIETQTGSRYEILREITQEDFEIKKRHAEKIDEYSKWNRSPQASIWLYAEDDVSNLPREVLCVVCTKGYCSDEPWYLRDAALLESIEIKYNGIRTDEKKIQKYNSAVDVVNKRIDENEEEGIDSVINLVNEKLTHEVKRLNQEWKEKTIEIYTSLDRLNVDSIDEDADVKEINEELGSIDKQIEILQAKKDGLKEALRKKRVTSLITWVNKKEYDGEESEKTEATLDPIREDLVKALREDSALKESSSSLFGRRR